LGTAPPTSANGTGKEKTKDVLVALRGIKTIQTNQKDEIYETISHIRNYANL